MKKTLAFALAIGFACSAGVWADVSDFSYFEDNGAITITFYSGPGGDVVIPDAIDGFPVTGIGNQAFYFQSSLTNIVIPGSVATIGDYAFSSCSLTHLAIPDSVVSIGEGAFSFCPVVGIDLGDGVAHIGNSAFWSCTSLTNIVLPGSVTNIGSASFSGCTSLSSIGVQEQNPVYGSVDGVLFDKALSTLLAFPGGVGGSYAIPPSVTHIGEYAFSSCTILTNVTIHDGVVDVGEYAFAWSGLEGITLPDSVTNIGREAFWSCENLTHASIGNGVVHIGDSAFTWCGNLSGVELGGNVVSIGQGAFSMCFSLPGITIPDSVASIGDAAFNQCLSLSHVDLGNGVSSIGSQAFRYCGSLHEITIPHSVTGPLYQAFLGCGLTNAVIGNGVTSLNGTFMQCYDLESVTIGSHVTDISEAFVSCSSLPGVMIPESVAMIGHMAFAGCSSLTNLMMPDSITGIGDAAFSACGSLTNLVLPDHLAHIGSYAFEYCTGLDGIGIPGTVTNIGANAFKNCSALTGIVIPDSVINLGEMAFYECANLADVAIGANVSQVYDWTFSHCGSLTNISVDALNSFLSSVDGVLFNKDQTVLLKFPEGKGGSYLIPDTVTSVGNYAFQESMNLTAVTIPASVATLGMQAFYQCSGLTDIYFRGDAPVLGDSNVFAGIDAPTIYYLAGTSGWKESFGGVPTTPWLFLLAVNGGTGSGSYTNGAVIAITASNAPAGQMFDRWTGDTQYVASVASPATTVTMPAENVEVTATCRSAPAEDFIDGFEGVDIDPFWVKSEQNGTVLLSSTQAHSGTQSVQFHANSGVGQIELHLRHFFDEAQYGTVTVWVYDSKESVYIWANLTEGNNPGLSIGMMDWDQSAYYYNAGITNYVGGKSAVARTVGWRKFTFQCLEDELVLSIDDRELYRGMGVGPFDTIRLSVSGPSYRYGTAYFDDFSFVSSANPDADGDGLPDIWERQYFDGTGVAPSSVCSNGVNTLLEAYVAGFDPTNPNAAFSISGFSGDTLQWNAASGRVYTVWWSTNLLNGFECLDSNVTWTSGSYTDTVHHSEGKGFYKLDVRMQE